ncbi:AAA family ATPase [Paractinoplanes globisporus]|uniref:ATP/GTP-binding protein n=1 Tax=Paractinoplanes globisporus TaxID=113565 RepID=A0ABW6WSM4_9ACTN|nr:ATP-binding protein [Actinoplanes globisporus]
MLRSFRVANHRSFRDEQELQLMPAYDKERPVVPVAAVFGANASGKSNLLDALRWMQSAVRESFRVWEADSGIPRVRYRLDDDESQPSSFVADLVLDGVQWVYGFSVTSEAVQEEWLHTYPHGRERVIFERNGQELELGSTVPERRSRAEILRGLMRDNALLLSVASQANQAEVKPVYRWFNLQQMHVTRMGIPSVRHDHLSVLIAGAHKVYPEFVHLLRTADFGISDISVEEPLFGRVPIVRFRHEPGGVWLELADQSEGTLAWAELLFYALEALKHGSLMILDEIDSSLHSRLTPRLVELFRNGETNANGAQLLFTTHDATLLGTCLGEDLLRRDEIWFVEKKDGTSRLYALSDFHPRKGENRERRYLLGSYGAVPVIFEDSAVDSLLEARRERADASA